MLYKKPKSNAVGLVKKGAIAVIIAETLAFGLTYAFYYRLNRNRDFRFYMHQNHPWVLDKFYSIGEYMSKDYAGRQLDLEFWSREQNTK